MRIGVDGFNLAMPHGTGIATYAAELVTTLKALGHQVDGVFGLEVPSATPLRQSVFFDRYRRPFEAPPNPRRGRRWRHVRRYLRAFGPHPVREVPLDPSVLKADDGTAAIPPFDRLFSAGRLFDDAAVAFARTGRFATIRLPDPPQVMHWTYPVPVRLAGARNIYTLHDLVPLKLPYMTLDNKETYGALIAGCVRHAHQICTVSDASRKDIVERLVLDPERITNTYQTATLAELGGADLLADARVIESLFGLSRRGYFLYFGAIEPKKNIGRLIEAHLRLRTATPLVLVGARAWQADAELQLMPGEGATGAAGTFVGPRGQTIIRLDYLRRDLLAKLVRGAKALLFPSLYEGFGLPVLEAMQLGTPVITSNVSSLPEVAGDAGLLVDPYDVEALVAAMNRVDADEDLGRAMTAKGLKQAGRFSRERYGERLTELYGKAMSGR